MSCLKATIKEFMTDINNIRNTVVRYDNSNWHCFTTAIIANMNFVYYLGAANNSYVIEFANGVFEDASENYFKYEKILYSKSFNDDKRYYDRCEYYI